MTRRRAGGLDQALFDFKMCSERKTRDASNRNRIRSDVRNFVGKNIFNFYNSRDEDHHVLATSGPNVYATAFQEIRARDVGAAREEILNLI